MRFEVNYKYEKYWIPPRCRKPRPGVFEGTIMVEVPEVSATDAPWACVVHGHRRYFDEYPYNALRHYNGRFYERAMTDMHIDRKRYAKDSYGDRYWWCDYETEHISQRRGMSINEMMRDVRQQTSWSMGRDEPDVILDIEECAGRYLIVNGEVWRECGEPMYCIYTFGLGHNHGGSSLSVDYYYNSNISHKRYFNANDFEDAINSFFETALGRGDTESAHFKAEELRKGEVWNHIEVIDPTAFKRNPETEHGDGDPFMNGIYALTSGVGSALEAGLLVMASVAKEIGNA